MSFTKYLAPNEKLLFSFRISLRWLVINIIFVLGVLGTPLWWTWFEWKSAFLSILLLGIIGFVLLIYFLVFISTNHFITNKKIYKKTGLIGTKVVSIDIEDITDIQIKQGVFEKLIFNMGTIKLNTAGSLSFEIIMNKINKPFEKKQTIYKIFQEHKKKKK